MSEIEPMGIPEPIAQHKQAITLYQIAVIALAALGVLGVVGGIVLAFFDKALPESVIAVAGVAVGALAGMVATGNRQ